MGVIIQEKDDLARLMKLANGEIMSEHEEDFYLKQAKRKKMIERAHEFDKDAKKKILKELKTQEVKQQIS